MAGFKPDVRYRYFIYDHMEDRWDETHSGVYRYIISEAQRMVGDARMIRIRGDVYRRLIERHIIAHGVGHIIHPKQICDVNHQAALDANGDVIVSWAVVTLNGRELKRIEMVHNYRQRLLEWAEEHNYMLVWH